MNYSTLPTRAHRASLVWPVILITLGVMFFVHEFVPDWSVWKTWPVLLVIIGVSKLAESSRPPRPPEGPRV